MNGKNGVPLDCYNDYAIVGIPRERGKVNIVKNLQCEAWKCPAKHPQFGIGSNVVHLHQPHNHHKLSLLPFQMFEHFVFYD